MKKKERNFYVLKIILKKVKITIDKNKFNENKKYEDKIKPIFCQLSNKLMIVLFSSLIYVDFIYDLKQYDKLAPVGSSSACLKRKGKINYSIKKM